MNGNRTIWFIGAALIAAGAYVLYRQSAAAAGGASGGSAGDTSGGDSSGAADGADTSALAGIGSQILDYATQLGVSLGIVTPKGLRNHNPGNLRYVASIPWKGQVGDDGSGYAVFDTDEDGVRALGHQLKTYASRGLVTVRQILSTFAPTNENDTAAYIDDLSGRLGVAPDTPLDVYSMLPQIADGIIHHENGVQPFTMDQLTQWVYEP